MDTADTAISRKLIFFSLFLLGQKYHLNHQMAFLSRLTMSLGD